MTDFVLYLLLTSGWIWGVNCLFAEDHIFEKAGDWVHDNLPEWVYKPTIGCAACMSSVHGTLSYFIFAYKDFGLYLWPVVDNVIIVFSQYSNFGTDDNLTNWLGDWGIEGCSNWKVEPNLNKTPHENEIAKRNYALDIVKRSGFTHFIMLDADEFYDQASVKIEKDYIEKNNVSGTVCKTKVYFKKPTLTVGFDHTLVPFIHKLTPELKFVLNNKTYPFAYDKQGNAHIDPTRRLNITSGVEWSDITMHHYSWVRSDYNLKIENSAARNNLKKSSIYQDLENAAPGVYNEFYRAELRECENQFNLPEL